MVNSLKVDLLGVVKGKRVRVDTAKADMAMEVMAKEGLVMVIKAKDLEKVEVLKIHLVLMVPAMLTKFSRFKALKNLQRNNMKDKTCILRRAILKLLEVKLSEM